MKLSMYLKVTLPQLKKITLPDFVVTGFLLASIYLVLRVGLSWQEVAMPAMEIDLSFSSLPRYALFSVSRAFIAIFLSLIFSIAYGTWAASSAKAERWLIPVLDIFTGRAPFWNDSPCLERDDVDGRRMVFLNDL